MAKAKIERTQKLFLKAMKEKFGADPEAMSTVFERKGLEQSARKVEFMKAGKKAEMERGISMYDPKRCHCGGIPLGQRQLTPYEVSTTGVFVEGDDLHFVNNAAMQQMWDDIRRTIIVGLDLAHGTLQKRLGKEVTPETINEYLHVLNHAMPGAAVVQEHMVETHPGLVDDCYVKVFTGDDEMADDLEPQFVLNLDKLFPAKMAAQTEGRGRQVDVAGSAHPHNRQQDLRWRNHLPVVCNANRYVLHRRIQDVRRRSSSRRPRIRRKARRCYPDGRHPARPPCTWPERARWHQVRTLLRHDPVRPQVPQRPGQVIP